MSNITRLQTKCATCGKVAKEKSSITLPTKTITILECGHVLIGKLEVIPEASYESLTFDGDTSCSHEWNKTICIHCNAKRLFPYQIAGAKAIENAQGRFAIFDEMGLGKTIQALAYLKFHSEAYPFLWVTKSGIKYQHAKEIVRVLGIDKFPLIIRSSKDKFIPGMAGYIVSYDLFRNLSPDDIKNAGIQSIILDECQAIKNTKSARTQSIRRIVDFIPRVIGLSGTPWKNRGSEFFNILNMLKPERFWSEQGFKDTWVDSYWDGKKYKEGGIRNPDKFKEQISDIAIRRERVDVMPELPLISRHKLLVELPEFARKTYDAEIKNLADIYNQAVLGGEEDSFETHAAIMQSLIVLRQIIGIAKVPSTIEFAQEFLEDTDRKLVIFVHHIKCGEMIYDAMYKWCADNHMAPPLRITSDVKPEQRFEVQEKFNSPKYRLLIASTLASGEGLNLQTCSDCIMHERQWNPANEEQAEGRFIRIGQQANAVNATYIHTDNSVDTELDRIVEHKRIAFHAVMNNAAMPIWNEKEMISELVRNIIGGK